VLFRSATGARARGSPGVGGVTRPPPGRGWSGRRDSNPRHTAWKAVALPTELLPRASEAVVGAARFELATPCSQSRCATRLRYAPTRTAREAGRESTTRYRAGRVRDGSAPARLAAEGT